MEKLNSPHIPSAAMNLLRQWPLYFVGIDRILGFFSISQQGDLQAIEVVKSGSGYKELDLDANEEMVFTMENYRKEKTAFQWLRPDLLPFVSRTTLQSMQLDLFSESKYLVLLIRTSGLASDYYDLYYLFFREDQSNFGVMTGQQPLDTTQKAIIGRLASQFAQLTTKSYQESENRFLWFKERTQSILTNNQHQKTEVNSDFNNWRKDWLVDYIREISQRDSLNYVLSEEAEKAILKYEGSFSNLKKSLESCIVYICELQNASLGDDIFIELSYLVLPAVKQVISNNSIEMNETTSRINKTMQLLDKLENAALLIVQRGLTPTSAEVGNHMDKPITAPAISDALRKNKVRIIQLFAKYPDSWPTIRQHFKPISNLMAKKNNELRATN
ncbi:MAG: hypothetical protein JEZ14_01435 [Marinilabiliaceae bacterium]|nr:hypothetical protein [Marinilabiliaceae bacterium]